MGTYNFIDLFAGCGGLSEGFYREGFHALAHVEIDSTSFTYPSFSDKGTDSKRGGQGTVISR